MKKSEFSIYFRTNEKFFLFNSLFGTIDEINEEIYNVYSNSTFHKLSKSEINYLMERYHLIRDIESHIDLYLKLYESYLKVAERKYRFFIPLTYDCNLSCVYCFQKNKYEKLEMKQDNLNKIFKSILKIRDKLKNKEKNTIIIYGGEPLLEKNLFFVLKIFEFASKFNFKVQIISNGINIPFYINYIKKYISFIENIIIILDGPPEVHNKLRIFKNGTGTFKYILNSVKILKENGVPYLLRINLTKDFFL